MIDSQMDDMIKEKLALKQQIDLLEQNLSNQIKEKESLLQTFTVFKNESKEKESKYMDKEIDLEKKINWIILFTKWKAQRIKPTLYDGSVISSQHAAIHVIDDEETLILEEVNFGKRFAPQQELSDEQAFWLQTSHPNTDQSASSSIKIKASWELPNVSLVNTSLKKRKYHLGQFDAVVKKRITPDANTEGEWGDNQNTLEILEYFEYNDLKAQVQAKDTTICKLKKHIKSMRENEKEEKFKHEMDENETINIELEHSETQKPEIKVYSRRPKQKKSVGLSRKAKIVESKIANNSEPNHLWGSNATNVPSSSSHVNDRFSRLFSGTVRFRNDQIVKIMGYGDYQLGNVIVSRVYYVEGLGHNLISIGEFCDADLEVNFWKNTCFIPNLEGFDLLPGSRDTNLYTISLDEMLKTSSIYLLSKASKTKSWLWHCGYLISTSNGVVKRRNRTLVEAARTMLIFSKAPLFLWAKAINTTCYTQNRSLIRLRYNKTPYELMHDKKPNLSFLHVFGSLCYPTNDSEDLGKLNAKADIGIFVGYTPAKKAFRIYNRRTRKIMETIHVTFDELTAMASEQIISGPGLQVMTPATSISGFVPNHVPQQPFNPPTINDCELEPKNFKEAMLESSLRQYKKKFINLKDYKIGNWYLVQIK
ncbi:integrase, catalytic region, zinc finger, CCHC-type containing protein [Tanacetum coccineum]